MMIRYLIIVITLVTLTGCATVEKRQLACEEQSNKFVDIFTCTKNSIATDIRLNKSSEVKLYLLKGEQLLEQLTSGKITELDAKTEWQKLFVELKGKEDNAQAQRIRNYNENKPKQTHCVPAGNSISCTTY